MSRPAHIAALDEALEKHMAALVEAEQRQVEAHEAHAAFLALHADEVAKVEAAQKARQEAYCAAQHCERAIRKLGYVVNGVRGDTASRLDGHPGTFRLPVSSPAPSEARDA